MSGFVTTYGLAILATCFYATLPVIAKKSGLAIPPLTFMAATMILLASVSVIAAWQFEQFEIKKLFEHKTLMSIILFASVNFVAFFTYLVAIQRIPVSEYQVIGGLAPIVASVLAYIVLGETITMWFFAGLPFIWVGLYLILIK